jgi:DNA-binding NarL/FixJ family response regulator
MFRYSSAREMSATDVTIVIADDHPIFLKGLREILEDEADFRIVGECHDGAAGLECIRRSQPDVAILDIEMPGMSGLDVAAVVQRDRIPTSIVLLTITDRVEVFDRAIDFGVVGYVLKEAAAEELVTGIRAILAGKYYFSPSIATHAALLHSQAGAPTHHSPALAALTPTERKVLSFIAENRSTAEIAGMLDISPRTVEKHRAHITEKLGLHGSYALVRYALQNRALL